MVASCSSAAAGGDGISRRRVMVISDAGACSPRALSAAPLIAGVAPTVGSPCWQGERRGGRFFYPAVVRRAARCRAARATAARPTACGPRRCRPANRRAGAGGRHVAGMARGWALGRMRRRSCQRAVLARAAAAGGDGAGPSTFLADPARAGVCSGRDVAVDDRAPPGSGTCLGPGGARAGVADRYLGGAAAWGYVLGAMGVGALIGSVLATRAAGARLFAAAPARRSRYRRHPPPGGAPRRRPFSLRCDRS